MCPSWSQVGAQRGGRAGKGVDGAACELQAPSLESWEVDMGSRGQGLPVHGGLSRRSIFLSPFKSSEPEEASNRGFTGVAEGGLEVGDPQRLPLGSDFALPQERSWQCLAP